MLTIVVEERELYNEATSEILTQPSFTLELEHSLVSLSKWESIFEKPFLAETPKTQEELIRYVECMILDSSGQVDLNQIGTTEWTKITEYIGSNQTATTFGELPEKPKKAETITSELIYYWLVIFTIPFEVEKWHLNRLFALIRICNLKNQKPTKKSKSELAQDYRTLNQQRKAKYNTKG
jgi:hypothetical protein